jgi:hypothetical protein
MNKVLIGLTLAILWRLPMAAADDQSQPPGLAVGVDLELAPVGSITTQIGTASSTDDAAASYGISGLLDVGVSPYLSVGFAPRYLLNIKTADTKNNPAAATTPPPNSIYARASPPAYRWQPSCKPTATSRRVTRSSSRQAAATTAKMPPACRLAWAPACNMR